jgi:hypothetical protein
VCGALSAEFQPGSVDRTEVDCATVWERLLASGIAVDDVQSSRGT